MPKTKTVIETDEKEVAIATPQPVRTMTAEGLIAQAIDKGVPIETMERLMNMRRELQEEAAKKTYVATMAAFQSECPIIDKSKPVRDKSGKVRYSYAPLDSIVKQVQPLLKIHGLSYAIDTTFEADTLTVTCTVTHEDGHSEKSSFRCPIDKDAYMSGPQKVGAAMSFGKRYAFCNVFGILTGDEDNDAQEEAQNEQPFASEGINQRLRLTDFLTAYGMPMEKFVKSIGGKNIADLSPAKAKEIADMLATKVKAGLKYEVAQKEAKEADVAPDKDAGDVTADYKRLFAAAKDEKGIKDVLGESMLDNRVTAKLDPILNSLADDRRGQLATTPLKPNWIDEANACVSPDDGALLLKRMKDAGASPTKIRAIQGLLETKL